MWFEDTVIAQVSHRWHTRNTFVSLPRHERIFPASVNQETKPSVKAFYFQRFECNNGNLILTSWLWVSWGYTQVSEYRERGAYFFDTLLDLAIVIQCPWTSSLLPLRQVSLPSSLFSHSCRFTYATTVFHPVILPKRVPITY